jgi:hypothetical protein
MQFVHQLLDGITTQPFHILYRFLTLPPDHLWPSISMLAGFMMVCELVRIAFGTELTTSRIAHFTVCALTFAVQAIVLAVVLVIADLAHPGRGWINLCIAFAMYVTWYLTGQLTKLVRSDSEGADVGFMTVGALITFPVGIVAAALT